MIPVTSIGLTASVMEKIRAWSAAQGGTFQAAVFFGVVIVLALAAFIWAVFNRQQPLRRRHRSHAHSSSSAGPDAGGPATHHHHHHRRHRRKKHRPVNPTLAETGGLPEVRDAKTPPKSHL